MGTFFPVAVFVFISCSSFSEIRSIVEAGDSGIGFVYHAGNLHPRAYRGDSNKHSLFQQFISYNPQSPPRQAEFAKFPNPKPHVYAPA